MTVVGEVGLRPLSGIIIIIMRVSTRLDVTISKWGERNIIGIVCSNIGLAV